MNGAQLKQEIKRRGFTFKSIADQMGLTQQAFGERLKENVILKSETVEQVAAAMGISVTELYQPRTATFSSTESIRQQRENERTLLRQLSTAAMQGLLAGDCNFSDKTLSDLPFEQAIARLSVQQAYAMLDEFKRHGIDK